jgi:hypothetical protein
VTVERVIRAGGPAEGILRRDAEVAMARNRKAVPSDALALVLSNEREVAGRG